MPGATASADAMPGASLNAITSGARETTPKLAEFFVVSWRDALTVSVTETVCGLFVVPAAVIAIEPVYVPAVTPVEFTETVSVPGADESVSHVVAVVADQVNVPPPVLETVTVCGGGDAPPTV